MAAAGSTFVLVHGGWHDAWCWNLLTPELTALGHEVVTMDLPCDDPAKSFPDYADVVAAAIPEGADHVTLVGHSLAGLTVPLVAERRSIDRMVLLCALVPLLDTSFRDQLGLETDMLDSGYVTGLEADDRGRHSWVDIELARHHLYTECDDAIVEDAFAHLRPQSRTPYLEPCALADYPSTPTTYVVCTGDRMVNPDWSRRFVPDHLDAELVEMEGDHSPFLSRPRELANLLTGL